MLDKNKVVVAMSGGVDSSLTAALLKEEGYDVIGLTMKLWSAKRDNESDVCTTSSVEEAQEVAAKLDIPFHVVDFEKLFKKKVVKDFKEEYARARTPNPCVVCNKKIKFGALLEKAKDLGAYYLATGHYAKIDKTQTGNYILKKADDPRKDQSYMLYNLTQAELRHILFPLAEYKKTETRKLAQEFNLNVHDKPESQEICFIPDDDYKKFLQENYPEIIKPGPILDVEGHQLGRHEGLPFYTIGQRRGLGLETHKKRYVVRLDEKSNAVIVGDNKDVFQKTLEVNNINWTMMDSLSETKQVEAKVRYNSSPSKATIMPKGKEVKVEFVQAERAVTPGQSIVFYDDDILLGGGIIKK